MNVVVTNPPRVGLKIAAGFAPFRIATVHEAQARTGLLAAFIRPIYREVKEAQTRARLHAGEVGLDIYGMREKLAEKGLVYRAADAEG